jgi:hypothetical protein
MSFGKEDREQKPREGKSSPAGHGESQIEGRIPARVLRREVATWQISA